MHPDLFKHQRRAIDECQSHAGCLVVRLPGAGKTRIGLELLEHFFSRNQNGNVLWLGPANLLSQYRDSFTKFGLMVTDVFPNRLLATNHGNLCSYDMGWRNEGLLLSRDWDLVICDEIHKAKSDKTRINCFLWKLRKKARRWVAFTGTPFQNSPYEFFELVSLCAGKHLGVECESTLQYRTPRKAFFRMFFRKLGFRLNRLNQGPIVGVSDIEKLRSILREYVDYLPPDQYVAECRMPRIVFQTEYVAMTSDEERLCQTFGSSLRRKRRVRDFFSDNLSDDQIEGCFGRLQALRTVALSGSKCKRAADLIAQILKANALSKILVFSNFVEKGLDPLSRHLTEMGIDHVRYTGKVESGNRSKYIEKFMGGLTTVMLMSPVGFEGLDLYGTTHIIIMDMHYNPERTKQLVSRARRAFSTVNEIMTISLISTSRSKCFNVDGCIEKIAERKIRLANMMEMALS